MIAHSLLHNNMLEVEFPEDKPSTVPPEQEFCLVPMAYQVCITDKVGNFRIGTLVSFWSLEYWKELHEDVKSITVYSSRPATSDDKTDLF